MFLNACKFFRVAVEEELEGSTLTFWAGVSNVTQEPLAFTTPSTTLARL